MNICLFVWFLLVLSCFSFMVLFARRKGGRHVHKKKKKKRTHRRLILAHLTLIYLAGRLIDLQVLYTLISTLIGMQY